MIGRQWRGKQQISIGSGCEYKGIAIHEMLHALGFYHEQTRLDRDKHVIIKYDNIKKGRSQLFQFLTIYWRLCAHGLLIFSTTR